MRNWQTIKRLLNATFWGVLVLLRIEETTPEIFMGPFTTAMGVTCHDSSKCPVLHELRRYE